MEFSSKIVELPLSGGGAEGTYAFFDRLRQLSAIHRVRLPNQTLAWLISDSKNISDLLSRGVLSRTPDKFQPPFDVAQTRKTAAKHLSERTISATEARISELVQNQLSELHEKQHIDLVRDFSIPISVISFCQQIGLSSSDSKQILRIVLSFSTVLNPEHSDTRRLLEDTHAIIAQCVDEGRLVDGILKDVVQSKDGKNIPVSEAINIAMQLLVAGVEPTGNMLSLAIFHMFSHHSFMNALSDPSVNTVSLAQQFEQFESPVYPGIVRFSKRDFSFCDMQIRKDDQFLFPIASISRSEMSPPFPSAETLVIKRHNDVCFGVDKHRCIGRSFSFMQLVIVLRIFPQKSRELWGENIQIRPTWSNHEVRALAKIEVL